MAKNLSELFNKYIPTDEHAAVLDRGLVVRSRVNKERRIIEVYASFDRFVKKALLYEIEDAIRDAYKLQFCKILPQYPKELFDYDYIPEILLEAERVGVVARGFFTNYKYTLEGNKLNIVIPFTQEGIMLLENAQTPKVIENIMVNSFQLCIQM